MFIDSHCHLDRLDLTPFSGDFSAFLAETRRSGIDRMLCVGISLNGYPAMRALIGDDAGIDVSVGVHPNEDCAVEAATGELVDLARDSAVVAVGETGLDYFHQSCAAEVQQQRFRRHIRAAREIRKPLIIHSRNAPGDTLRLLAEEGAEEVGGVFHCFTEDWPTARRALDMNFMISFSGIVTFKSATTLQDVARKVPADRYLIETDSPYLAPIPRRGKPNYPHYVRYVAEALAVFRGSSVTQVADESSRNYSQLFGKPG